MGLTSPCKSQMNAFARPPPVCLSSDHTTHADTSQDRQVQSHCVAGGSLLAREGMVSFYPAASQWSALVSSTEAGSPVTVEGEHLASSPRAPPVACLAPEGRDLLLNFYDQAVFQTIISAPASSTRLMYANRWKLFSGLFDNQKVDPEHCSVPVLLKYLQTLLDKGLSWKPCVLLYLSPWNTLTSGGCLARLPSLHLQSRLMSFMPCLLQVTVCGGILMDRGLLCGPTPLSSPRGFLLFMLTNPSIWQLLPQSPGWRDYLLMPPFFVLFAL